MLDLFPHAFCNQHAHLLLACGLLWWDWLWRRSGWAVWGSPGAPRQRTAHHWGSSAPYLSACKNTHKELIVYVSKVKLVRPLVDIWPHLWKRHTFATVPSENAQEGKALTTSAVFHREALPRGTVRGDSSDKQARERTWTRTAGGDL